MDLTYLIDFENLSLVRAGEGVVVGGAGGLVLVRVVQIIVLLNDSVLMEGNAIFFSLFRYPPIHIINYRNLKSIQSTKIEGCMKQAIPAKTATNLLSIKLSFLPLFYYHPDLKIIMTGLYDQLCNMFIKPARQTYSDHDLGPFALGHHGVRQNFTFTSFQGHEIKASFFKNKSNNCNTCVIYLHSFNGSRLQSLRYATDLLQKHFHFCCFDFPGCGNSGGQFVSLGCNERWDILKLLQRLKQIYGVTQFFLWGRSMGAVAAIKFYSLLCEQKSAGRSQQFVIVGLILDSPFISLKRMIVEVGQRRISVPQLFIKAIFLMVSSSIEEKAKFKFDDLELQADVETIKCSTLLVTSKQDSYVNFGHSEEIFARLRLHDNKQIEYTMGEHYQTRDNKTINNIYSFIENKYKRFSDSQHRLNNLKESTKNYIQRISFQRPTKSLRKYEAKQANQKIDKMSQSRPPANNQIIPNRQVGNQIFPKTIQSTQLCVVGSDHKIPLKSSQVIDKNYNTQKKINHPQIKIIMGCSNEIKHKNKLRNKSKPSLFSRIDQPGKHKTDSYQLELTKSAQRTLQTTQNQQNHCNIITDKLKRKAKNHKIIDFKDRNDDDFHQPIEIHRKKPKINFTLSNLEITPVRLIKEQKQAVKKYSMTAQQYKNTQLKSIKEVVALSPKIKRRGQKQSCFGLKASQAEEKRHFQQCKSMNNLIMLGGNDRKGTRSYKNVNSLMNIEFSYSKKE